MVKKSIFSIISILAVLGMGLSTASADTSQSFQMGAGVSESISLAMDIFETNVISEATKVTSGVMNFGNLVYDESSQTYYGGTYFTVVFWPSSNSGTQWQLKMSAGSLTDASTGETLPDGACIYDPWGTDHNGAAFPTGSVKGTRGSIVGTDQVLFTSNSTGTYTSVPVTFIISNNPSAGATEFITNNQRAGTYETTVVVNMTAAA